MVVLNQYNEKPLYLVALIVIQKVFFGGRAGL